MNAYIQLLKSEPIIKRLSIIQLISYFGAWFSNIAIYTLLLEMNVSASVIAFVAMLHFLAGVFQAPFSGPIIDSFKPKRLMLFIVLIEMFATFALIFINSVNDLRMLYLLIFIKMAGASFYFTTEMSLLPKLLEAQKLQKANEMHSIIWSLSYTLGMSIGGFVVYIFGIKLAFLIDSMMFFSAYILLVTLKIEIDVIHTHENFLQMMQGTFAYLKKEKLALQLMILHAFVGLTAFDALVALMVDKYYAGLLATSLALGLLHSFRALGLVLGPIVLSKYLKHKVVVYVFMAQGVAVSIWAFVMSNFYLSLLSSILVGFFTTTLWSYTYTLLQKNIDAKYYGRIVAYNDMLFLSSAALTSFMIGFLATHNISLETITLLMAGGFVVGGFYFVWILKSNRLEEIGYNLNKEKDDI